MRKVKPSESLNLLKCQMSLFFYFKNRQQLDFPDHLHKLMDMYILNVILYF